MNLQDQQNLAHDISMLIYQKIRLINGYRQTSYKMETYYGEESNKGKITNRFVYSFGSVFLFDAFYNFDEYRKFMSDVENALKDFSIAPLTFQMTGLDENSLELKIIASDFQEALKDKNNSSMQSMININKFNL